jgi:TetR/AcrR family fatty acid metabolism transcriptional regulator
MNKKEYTNLLATKAIAEEVHYKTEVKAITDNAEMAIGTIYMYFKSKEEILDYYLSHNILG